LGTVGIVNCYTSGWLSQEQIAGNLLQTIPRVLLKLLHSLMADDATLPEKRDRLLFILIWLIELFVVNLLPGLGILKQDTQLFVRSPTMSTTSPPRKAPVAPTPAKARPSLMPSQKQPAHGGTSWLERSKPR